MENINESIAISQRFFEALEQLIRTGRLKSISEFGKRYGLVPRNMYFQRSEPSRQIIRPSWLAYLSRDYQVSAHWLLTGEGPMMTLTDEKRAGTVSEIKALAESLL